MKKTKLAYRLLATLLISSATFAACAEETGKAENDEAKVKPSTVFANKSQAILFKIHDIKPVLNSDNVVTACQYTATFFNRTPNNLRRAKLELTWTDQISALYTIENPDSDEDKLDDKTAEANEEVKQIINTGETMTSTIDLPALNSLKQTKIEETVPTDKCFALFEKPKIDVPVCDIFDKTTIDNNNRRGQSDQNLSLCAALFVYVDSKNPEYYGEFKEIDYAEEQAKEKSAEELEKEELKVSNEKIQKNIEKASEIITKIK